MNRIIAFLRTAGCVALLFPAVSALYGAEGELSYLDKLPPLIDREIFFDDPEISGAQLSPDGAYMSFRKQYNGVMNIWVKDAGEPFDAARPVTADSTRPIPGYFWSRDSRYILYIQDAGGDENFNLYAVDPASEPDPELGVPIARALSDFEDVQTRIYSVPRNTPDYVIIGINDRDPSLHDVYRFHIGTGEHELIYRNEENIVGFDFDNDGVLRFASRQTSDGGTEILSVRDGQLEPVYRVKFEEDAGIVRIHPDGERAYLVTNKGEDVDLMRLVLFDPGTGEEELIEMDPEGEADYSGAIFSNVTDELLATYYVGDRMRVYYHNDEFERHFTHLNENLPDGDVYLSSRTADERTWLVYLTSDVDPGASYIYDLETGEIEFLYRPRPNLPVEHLAEMIPVRYTARDGLEIPAYLTIPKGVEPIDLAVIVMPHGGPWARDTWGYDAYAQFLANRGYAVFQPNFRGSTGFGKEFLNAGNKEWGTGAMQHDITDGVQYLIDEGIADPDRIGIFGGSYGGYATLAGLAFTPELYAAGISFVGPSNIITLIESIPAYWRPIVEIFHRRVGNPDDPDDHEMLVSQSPLFSADRIVAPLLVVQGANDPRVVKQESDQIVVAMRDLERHVEYIVAPDEGHGFARPINRLTFTYALERFFADHLGGRYQTEVSDEIAQRLVEITVPVEDVTLPEAVGEDADTDGAGGPEFLLDRIQPQTAQFRSLIETGGQELTITSQRTIDHIEWKGGAVWRVIESAQSPMGAVADTVYIHDQTLRPLYRSAKQGQAVIKLTYEENTITGGIQVGPQEQPIDISLEEPVFGDGGGLDLALAALPLDEGYATSMRTFDIMRQRAVVRRVAVTGIEEVSVPAGIFSAYIVELTSADSNTGSRTVWISVDDPRRIVRSIDELPPMMGGGSVTTELQSIEIGEI
jgi:dipeptidyl aminopeptidase/acylaminoacyl peptidase